MNRYSLKDNILRWADMVIWLRENFGEEQRWTSTATEPRRLKKSHNWAVGEYRINPEDPDSFCWLCLWIPDGAVHTAFVLRWAR